MEPSGLWTATSSRRPLSSNPADSGSQPAASPIGVGVIATSTFPCSATVATDVPAGRSVVTHRRSVDAVFAPPSTRSPKVLTQLEDWASCPDDL